MSDGDGHGPDAEEVIQDVDEDVALTADADMNVAAEIDLSMDPDAVASPEEPFDPPAPAGFGGAVRPDGDLPDLIDEGPVRMPEGPTE
jgi:hypothetical protein